LLLREQIADGFIEFGAGLEDAGARDLQREVLPAGGGHQLIEDRVVEIPPPINLGNARRAIGDETGVHPVTLNTGRGCLVIRADLAGDSEDRHGANQEQKLKCCGCTRFAHKGLAQMEFCSVTANERASMNLAT